jgi:hypothetical protein
LKEKGERERERERERDLSIVYRQSAGIYGKYAIVFTYKNNI